MSYSDDYASPATPFEAGNSLDSPDLITESPITSERVVDTQSGFLVVVKRLESRLSLSVKRRIGTPPSSSVLLTPDESVKLSKILLPEEARDWESRIRRSAMSTDIDGWLDKFTSDTRKADSVQAGRNNRSIFSRRDEDELDELDEYNQLDQYETDEEAHSSSASRWDKFILDDVPPPESRSHRRARKPAFAFPQLTPKAAKTLGIVSALILLLVSASAVVSLLSPQKSSKEAVTPLAGSSLSEEKVDRFARTFVSNMLDFSPSTYKVSQVQAMSVMKPELLERYWQETNFPLSRRQLGTLPQGQTVLITRVQQDRIDETTKDVDIYAELVSADGKLSSPVHLKLKVTATPDGALQITEQKDLTAGGHD